MTDVLQAVFAVMLTLILNVGIVRQFGSRFPAEESRVLVRYYWLTLFLRCILAILLNIFVNDSRFFATFWGDSSTYDWGGYLLSRSWSESGDYLGSNIKLVATGWGFQYYIGAIYYVFGRNQLLIQLINATIGAISVVVMFAIARDLFDGRIALRSAKYMAFFPQMVFWSSAMYKDPAILLCIALCIYAVLKLRARFTFGYLSLYILSGLALVSLRFYIFYMVAFATLGTFIFTQRRGLIGSLLAQLTIVASLLVAFTLGVRQEIRESQQSFFNLDVVEKTRRSQAQWAQSGYGTEFDVSTPEGAFTALPKGLVYLFLTPFPWMFGSLRQNLAIPEGIVWYSLLPALARGLLHTIRHRFRDALPILAFTCVLTVAYALFQGNVGTAYRQRTQINMFFFIFMAVGVEQKLSRRAIAVRPRTRFS